MRSTERFFSSMLASALAAGLAVFCLMAFPKITLAQNAGSDGIQVGYAIVTPDTSNLSGPVVLEAMGDGLQGINVSSGTPVPGMATQAMLMVNGDVNLLSELALAVANPGSENAFVMLILRRNDGSIIGTAGMTVWAHMQRARFLSELFTYGQSSLQDLPGMLQVFSNIPISFTGLRFRNWSFEPVPVSTLDGPFPAPERELGVGGRGAVVVPYFAVGNGWDTGLFIANPGSAPLTVRVDLYRQSGAPMIIDLDGGMNRLASPLTIPPGGVFVLKARGQN